MRFMLGLGHFYIKTRSNISIAVQSRTSGLDNIGMEMAFILNPT